jgi:hypothetical protein
MVERGPNNHAMRGSRAVWCDLAGNPHQKQIKGGRRASSARKTRRPPIPARGRGLWKGLITCGSQSSSAGTGSVAPTNSVENDFHIQAGVPVARTLCEIVQPNTGCWPGCGGTGYRHKRPAVRHAAFSVKVGYIYGGARRGLVGPTIADGWLVQLWSGCWR